MRTFLTICLCLWAACQTRAGWTLTWSDDFNGTALDTNAWWCDLGLATCINGNNELGLYTNAPGNVQVTNGYARLIGLDIGTGGNHLLTSPRMMTMNIDDCGAFIVSNMTPHFVTVGGAVEWRARIPQGTGLWPALWLMPREAYTNDFDPFYGGWPNSGEVDVMENNGSESNQNGGTLHYRGGQSQTTIPVSDVTQWHTYRIEWMTNSFTWYVDGVAGYSVTNWTAPVGYSYPAPFDAASGGFFVIMDLALGGNYTGNPSAATVSASLPAEMDVDYVRIYSLSSGTNSPGPSPLYTPIYK